MANVQMARQRNVQRQTVTATQVNLVQSLCLVQTMLHGGLSTLLYLRGLFPDRAFEQRIYQMQDTVLPYEDFAAGRMPTNGDDAFKPYTKLPVLLRARSKRADQFLDWLEKGVMRELESGQLRAVQVLVHPASESRNEVLETYTFTIHYTTSEKGERTPSGLATSASKHVTFLSDATNTSLQQLFRKVADMCNDLPALPSQRMISMSLIYDGETVKSRLVDGFMLCEDSDLFFASSEDWQPYSEALSFATGHHNSNLKISGLQPKADQNAQYQQVPDRVAFIHKVSRYIDVSKPSHHSTQNLRPQKPNERPETPLRNITLSPFGSKKSHTAKSPSSRVTRGRMTKEASLSLGGRDTQQSLVNNMNDDLHGMMQPEQITQGDTQTQGVFNSTDTFPDASTATPTTIRALVLGPDEIETPFKIAAYSLRSAIRKRVQSKKLELQSEVVALAQKAGGTTASGEIIVCQCGLRKEEGDMVQCFSCMSWQHLHCYGYVGNEDPRLHEEHLHICYGCILAESDADAFAALQQLTTERRVMYRVFQYGLRSKSDLSNDLDIEQKTASDLHNRVRKERFVTQAAKSHKSGYRATGKALFVPAQDEAMIRTILNTFFDPMTHIKHHYDILLDERSVAKVAQINQGLLLAMRKDLPEPAARHNSKLNSMTPTSAGSEPVSPSINSLMEADMPSATMHETPAMKSRRLTQTAKRKASTTEEGSKVAETTTTPLKSQRRFGSLQTVGMINAGGESSPVSSHASVSRTKRR